MQLFIIVLLTQFSIACTTEPTPHENKNQQPNKSDGAAITVSAEKIKGHMAFLADDLLQGRETGTRGYDLAALYVASRFQAVGCELVFKPLLAADTNHGSAFATCPSRIFMQP